MRQTIIYSDRPSHTLLPLRTYNLHPAQHPPVEPNSGPTGDRPAFFGFHIDFYNVYWIPDHQSYIIDRVNLNRSSQFFLSSELRWAILLIQSHVGRCNGQLITNRVLIILPLHL